MINIKYLSLTLFTVASLICTNKVEFFFKDKHKAIHHVQPAFVDKSLRDIPIAKLKKAIKYMAIRPTKMDDGSYALRAHVRGDGGGPIFAAAAYGLTKCVCYGVALAGAGTVVVATGGAAGAATGALVGAVGGAASAGTAAVAGAIAGAGLATEAGLVTASIVANAGSVAAAAAFVEGLSTWIFVAVSTLPTP